MAQTNSALHSAPTLANRKELLLFGLSFVVFLVIALIAQMLTMRWRTWLPGAEGEGSLIAGVKSAVYTFMSYIP